MIYAVLLTTALLVVVLVMALAREMRLRRALEMKLFEDQKDSIKLSSLVSQVIDRETQEKIDVVKTRLKEKHGYCETCATDVLNFVASIFARGDARG